MQVASPALALDLTRLAVGMMRATPRGIDRVELLYARHFLSSWSGPCVSILATPLGPRLFAREQTLRAVDALATRWGEDEAARRGLARTAVAGLRVGVSLGVPAARALPPGAIYLNVGHLGLSSQHGLDWLGRRPDVCAVFMLHDLIPLTQPQYVSPREQRYFARVVDAVRLARGLILNSHAVAETRALIPHLPEQVLISHLPVPPAFLGRAAAPREAPYFVACGQVETRKNLQLLGEVWKRLALAAEAPLIIAGARGDASHALAAQLDAWDPQRRHVRMAAGLTTPQLRDLMGGASALLAPSLAEGFGLPVVEALAMGVPVIASDIAAHREVGGACASYLDPADPQAWLAAIGAHLRDPSPLQAKAAAFRPRRPEVYFSEVESFLRQV